MGTPWLIFSTELLLLFNRLSEPWGLRQVELVEVVGDLLHENDLKTKKAVAEVFETLSRAVV